MDNTKNLNNDENEPDSISEDVSMDSEPLASGVSDSNLNNDETEPDSTSEDFHIEAKNSASNVTDSTYPHDTPELVTHIEYLMKIGKDFMNQDSDDMDMNITSSVNNFGYNSYDTPYPKNISVSSHSHVNASNFKIFSTAAAVNTENIWSFPPFYTNTSDYISPRGLLKTEINRIPTKTFHDIDTTSMSEQVHEAKKEETGVDVCGICYVNYENGTKLRILPCSHNFHKNCVDPWLKIRSICPFCRKNVL